MNRLRDIAAMPAVAGTGAAARDPGLVTGAQASAARSTGSVSNTSDNSVETNINGPITVHTQAKDADGVASGLADRLKRYSFVQSANSGLA